MLTAAGHACLGERHGEIINNQKAAIAQFRERVTELELAKPPSKKPIITSAPVLSLNPVVGSHQATLKELSRVRHELLKARSKKADVVGTSPPSIKEADTITPQVEWAFDSCATHYS
jgi:hypothetical protein